MPDTQRHGVLSFRGAPVGAVQGGCLCFEGTRIPVSTILAFMKGQDSDASILHAYPSLTQLDLDAARWFDAKWQVRRRRLPARGYVVTTHRLVMIIVAWFFALGLFALGLLRHDVFDLVLAIWWLIYATNLELTAHGRGGTS